MSHGRLTSESAAILDYIQTSKMAANKGGQKPATYFETLDSSAATRYSEKISIIGATDPYQIPTTQLSTNPDVLPGIVYRDIVNYLIFNPSPYTADDLGCFKGLEAYNLFVCGWVRDVSSTIINGKHVVLGRVMHSQKLRETPLKPWLIAEKTGRILSGHCNCVAGLGETCTHVSALLFYIETKVRIRDSQTVTQEPAYWKLPASFREVSYHRISEMDFSSARAKKRKLDTLVEESDIPLATPTPEKPGITPSRKTRKDIPTSTEMEMKSFFHKLSEGGSKAAVLSVVPEHSQKFKSAVLDKKYPKVLTDLFQSDNISKSYVELLDISKDVDIAVTAEQAKCVEQATKGQASSKAWFRFRSGRVTASKMKRVCRSNPDLPSQSLVRDVCYPRENKFTNTATKWGCEHEKIARESYMKEMEQSHVNFSIQDSGLVINPNFPHVGASPDGITSCDCCGTGVLEIKCPFCAKDKSVEEYFGSGVKTCLVKNNEKLELKGDHEYMYQIQTQIHVCDVEFSDFVLNADKDLHIQRVESKPELWQEIEEKSLEFFQKALLPELLGKLYSRPSQQNTLNVDKSANEDACSDQDAYCYCRGPEDKDDMIACDNQNCKIIWFHINCLKIKKVPKGKWFCPECRKVKKGKNIQ